MNLDQITCGELLNRYPWAADFFLENYLNPEAAAGLTLPQYLDSLSDEHLADLALERPVILANFKQFFRQMRELLGEIRENQVSKLTLLPGHDKDGRPESFEHIDLYPSEITACAAAGSRDGSAPGGGGWRGRRYTPPPRARRRP